MFKDAQKELQRLEELLAEEEEEEISEEEFDEDFDEDFSEFLEDEIEEDEPEGFDQFDQDAWENPHATLTFRSGAEKFRQQLAAKEAGSRVYNSDRTDAEPEDLEDESVSGGSLKGLVILAVLLTLGIVGMVIWFLLHYGV